MIDRSPQTRQRGDVGRDGSRLVVGLALLLLVAPAIVGLGAGTAIPADPTAVGTSAGGPIGDDASAAEPAAENWSMAPSAAVERSVAEAGASDLYTDPDDDGLATIVERQLGIDPLDPDTDGDGLPDGAEVTCTETLPGADPLHQDLYLEVDSETGEHLDAGAIERAERTFASAPVSNPDGRQGIDLHVRRDDGGLDLESPVDTNDRPGPANDVADVTDAHRDYGEEGHYYVVLASDVAYDGDPYYVGAGQPGFVMLEPYENDRLTASLLVHELGHAVGFDESIPGVDDERYSLEEYPSVMNYNGLYEIVTYSNGSGSVGRNEWAYVANERHQPPVTCGPDGTVMRVA